MIYSLKLSDIIKIWRTAPYPRDGVLQYRKKEIKKEGKKCATATLKKDTHIKGRLLDQAVIFINCVPFQNVNFSYRKEFAPRGSEFFPWRVVPYRMENYFYHIRWPPFNVTIFITHVRNCVIGATPMKIIRFWFHLYIPRKLLVILTSLMCLNMWRL